MSAQVMNAPQPNSDGELQQMCTQMDQECQQKKMQMCMDEMADEED